MGEHPADRNGGRGTGLLFVPVAGEKISSDCPDLPVGFGEKNEEDLKIYFWLIFRAKKGPKW